MQTPRQLDVRYYENVKQRAFQLLFKGGTLSNSCENTGAHNELNILTGSIFYYFSCKLYFNCASILFLLLLH